jgi:hypothetical protein
MDEEVYPPLHRLQRAVAVVKLHREFPIRGCHGEDVVGRSAQLPQPNVVERVPAGHLTCEIDLGGDYLTRHAGTHGLNATDQLGAVHRLDSHRTFVLFW